MRVKPPHPVELVRPREDRPRWSTVLVRSAVVVIATGLGLLVLAWLLPGLVVETFGHAMLAALVLGVLNALVWPALAFLVVRVSALTLGIGAVALEVFAVVVILRSLPGIEISGWGTALAVVAGIALLTVFISWAFAVDDDIWFDQRMTLRRRRLSLPEAEREVPGLVMVQIDGLSIDVLQRALQSGDAPTLRRWLADGSHRLTDWETGWSSQTGVSQAGILHGSSDQMPAFRWMEKESGQLVVSNRPLSAAYIEGRHDPEQGLLAHRGSSYGNLFTGGAERAVMTMSVVAQRKEGRIGAGYGRYFSKPQNVMRTVISVVVEVARERRAALLQRRRDVQPRVKRTFGYAFLRAFTTVIARDVCVQGVIDDVARGQARIYVNLVGYDEVAHHSGPERADALAVLRDIDEQVRRIDRSFRWAPRPYRMVLLSDHGQTQGETFAQRNGSGLDDLVARLTGAEVVADEASEEGHTESVAWARSARRRASAADAAHDADLADAARDAPTVLASGGLGLVYFPGESRRWTLADIDAAYPSLIDGLVGHHDIGFVLVRGDDGGSVVIGANGRVRVDTGEVVGENPLTDYGQRALRHIREVDGYDTVADLMINARYNPELDEMTAFESQVGSHGALGGAQNRPVLIYPADLPEPEQPLLGAAAVHHQLKHWMSVLGQP